MSRRPPLPRSHRLLATVVALLVLSGCTGSEQGEATPSTSASTAPSGTATPAVESVPVADLSAQLLTSVARPGDEVDVLGSQTVLIEDSSFTEQFPVTIDVLAVQRLDDATLLTLQMSSPAPQGQGLGPDVLTGTSNSEFFDSFGLDDTTAGVRYRALTWRRGAAATGESAQQPTNSCICPYRHGNLALGPTPIVSDSLYGPLPDTVTTVTLTGPNGVRIPDLPVTPG